MTDARADRGVVDPAAGRRRLVVTTSFPRHAGDAAGNFVAARVQALVAAGERVQVIAAGEPSPHEPAGVAVQRIPFALPGVPPLFYGGGAPERLEPAPLPAVLQAARFWGGLLPAIRARAAALRGGREPLAAALGAGRAACQLAVAGPRARPGVPVHVAHAHSGDVALLERLPGGGALARWLLRQAPAVVLASEDLRARLGRLAGRIGRATDWTVRPAQSPLLTLLRPRPAAERQFLRAYQRLALWITGRAGGGPAGRHQGPRRAGAGGGAAAPGAAPHAGDPGRGDRAGSPGWRWRAPRGVDLRLPGEVPPADGAGLAGAGRRLRAPQPALVDGRTEGQPVAVREALAAGVPVVARPAGGSPSCPARLLLVAPDDPGALASAIMRHLGETRYVAGCHPRSWAIPPCFQRVASLRTSRG